MLAAFDMDLVHVESIRIAVYGAGYGLATAQDRRVWQVIGIARRVGNA
jgi:hypothetical protein